MPNQPTDLTLVTDLKVDAEKTMKSVKDLDLAQAVKLATKKAGIHVLYPGTNPKSAVTALRGTDAQRQSQAHLMLMPVTLLTAIYHYKWALDSRPLTDEEKSRLHPEIKFWMSNYFALAVYGAMLTQEIHHPIRSAPIRIRVIRFFGEDLYQEIVKFFPEKLKALEDIQPHSTRTRDEITPPWIRNQTRADMDLEIVQGTADPKMVVYPY